MNTIPNKVSNIIQSTFLRNTKLEKLLEMTDVGPVGVRRYGGPVEMILVSRGWWDAHNTETD